MTGGKWKKVLLPSLGNRRKPHSSTSRLSASKTAVTHSIKERPRMISGDDDLDERVISALLGTTAGIDDGDTTSELLSQPKHVTRSHTVGVMSSSRGSNTSGSPYRVQKTSISSPSLPRKSSRRKLRTITRDFSRPSPRRSPDEFVRRLTKSHSSRLLGVGTHRTALLSSIPPARPTGRRLRKGSIQKGDGVAENISHSVTSVLAAANDVSESAAGSIDSTASSRITRFKNNKMFAKLAGALSEHFSAKGSRKDDKAGGTITVNGDKPDQPIIHGLPLGRLTLAQLPLAGDEASGTSIDRRLIEHDDVGKQKVKVDAGLPRPPKRSTLVDEVDFQKGQPLDDPFSELSSAHQSTEFDARLKSVQASGGTKQKSSTMYVSDPFLTERIMDTSVNSILKTPPIGCSTPRNRSRSLISCRSPTRDLQVLFNSAAQVLMVSPGKPPTSPPQRREVAIICESPTRISASSGSGGPKENSSGNRTGSPSKLLKSSDSTRLSSYPPGSTIRHVPRSMGRLADVPDLSMPNSVRRRSPLIGKKKHPSPSKVQLDLYGKLIEKNLALGVFKDTDELAMDYGSHKGTISPALSPRDKNRLMRGSAASNIDLRKNYMSQGLYPGLPAKSRSRIPQPVRLLPRSQTESVSARDFLATNHGDISTEDELQWDSSDYKVGRGRGSRCYHCGSMAEGGL